MSKDQKDNVTETDNQLGNTSKFVQENAKSLAVIAAAIIALVLLYFGYQNFYLAPRAEKAANEMYKAEEYVAIDSLKDRAIKGDGSYPGFEKIADEYSGTDAGNLANYYAGIAYLNTGKYAEAIEYLGKFKSDDLVISAMATGAIGDAYSQKNQPKEALEYYVKAAESNKISTK